jgi:hypothetical protein
VAAAAVLAGAAAYGELAPSAPAVLTGSSQSMWQYESFRAHVDRDGPHDFIVLGNSFARQGVRTRLLDAELQAGLGRPVRGYNFASGGVSAPMLPLQTRLAYGIDQPPLCLFVINPPMLAVWTSLDGVRNRSFEASPYGLAVGDSLRWRGAIRRALLDGVGLFRWRYTLKDRLVGEPPAPRRIGRYHEAAGFAVIAADPDDLEWATVQRRYRNWSIEAERNGMLAEAVRVARDRGARVILVEAARHPDTASHVPDLDAKLRELQEALLAVGAAAGADVILQDGGLHVSAADFLDTHHLNEQGAEAFTVWLARRIPAEALH